MTESGPRDIPRSRTIITIEAESLEGERKQATATRFGHFTIVSDEPPAPGAPSSAPPPLEYFAASILF